MYTYIFTHIHMQVGAVSSTVIIGVTTMSGLVLEDQASKPPVREALPEILVFHCRTTSASTAPCKSRRMCCPTHCASHCAPRREEADHCGGGVRSPNPETLKPEPEARNLKP